MFVNTQFHLLLRTMNAHCLTVAYFYKCAVMISIKCHIMRNGREHVPLIDTIRN